MAYGWVLQAPCQWVAPGIVTLASWVGRPMPARNLQTGVATGSCICVFLLAAASYTNVRASMAPQKEDLHILCERHTTSKLRKFEDLVGIQTLGFRQANGSRAMPGWLAVAVFTKLQECWTRTSQLAAACRKEHV